MNNYQFCVQWILSQQQEKNIKVLDYGCGVGKIVESLRKSKVNAFGCDVFYEGANRLSQVSRQFLESTIIRKMDNNTIPFEDASFDFVINNQVIEHVENIDIVLTEIQRVLKSGGKVLNLFPDSSNVTLLNRMIKYFNTANAPFYKKIHSYRFKKCHN